MPLQHHQMHMSLLSLEEEHVAYVETMLYLCVVRMTFSLRIELDEILYRLLKNVPVDA